MGKNVETTRGMYEAFAEGDIAAVLGAMDDNVNWVYPEGGLYDTQIGPQAVAENVFAVVANDFADFTATVAEYVDGGDVVCAIGRYGGSGAETGKPLDVDFVHVVRFGPAGKIVRWQEFTDSQTVRAARGR